MKIQISIPSIIEDIKLKLFWIKSITESTAREQRNILHKQDRDLSPELKLQRLKEIKALEEEEKKSLKQ